MDAQKLYDKARTFRVPKQVQRQLDELKTKWDRKNYSQVILLCIERTWQDEMRARHNGKGEGGKNE